MLPLALIELPQLVPAHVGLGTLGLLAYCALLPAAAANVVVFAAIKILGPTRVMLFQFLVPAFAVVMAAFFLGEAIVLGQVLGGLVIVLGILVARSRRLARAVGQERPCLRRARTRRTDGVGLRAGPRRRAGRSPAAARRATAAGDPGRLRRHDRPDGRRRRHPVRVPRRAADA